MCRIFNSVLNLLQKFDNRALVVMESEIKYWSQLTVDFMTEESDNDDDGNIISSSGDLKVCEITLVLCLLYVKSS